MEEKHIDLKMLTPHGKANTKITDETLEIWTTHSVTSIGTTDFSDKSKMHYVSLPEKYRLPFRVDMTVKLDFPAFYLLIGNGHITFASQGQDNRKIEDIIIHTGKPNQDRYSYNNSLPLGEYVDISVTCNLNEMQISIGGEERFYSRRQAYMRAKNLSELNAEGILAGLAVSKLSTLSIKTISVTELDEQAAIVRGEFEEAASSSAAGERPKPTFESVISGLPRGFGDRIIEMDHYLRAMRPLKFKRMVDKGGYKITYVASDFGVSYAINVFDSQFTHYFNWYIVYNGKPETWHRKADDMEETLVEIAKSDPQLSERIFYALNDCVGCYGSGCLAKTLYAYNGQKRLTCHGRVLLRMYDNDLHDAKEFFRHLNMLIERKIENGDLHQEKILLMKV